jgi:hypothetical protein
MSDGEIARRVVYAFLYNIARLADRLDDYLDDDRPLKAVGKELQVAWFHALRRRGLKLREISERLGISSASAANLSKRLKNNFLAGEGHMELARRIQFMIEAEPLSVARVAQILVDAEPANVQAAVDTLLEEGRIVPLPGRVTRYRAQRSSRVVRDQILGRLDGLNQLVGAVTQVAYTRFFKPETPAFARVLQLRARPADRARLRALYEQHIWPLLAEIDAAAVDADDAETLEFVLSWSAYEAFADREE